MQLDLLTLTGADDGVSPAALAPLVDHYPGVEWAILFSPVHEGQARYPSTAWRQALYAQCPRDRMHRSAHLCGAAVRAFAKQEESLWAEIVDHYDRIQLNFNVRHLKPGVLDALVIASERLAQEGVTVITQHNEANVAVADRFATVSRHAVLFDASGGRGTRPEAWPAPLVGHACGYAGGLGPANVVEALNRLDAMLPADYVTWIDMESSLRTPENVFDLDRVRAVADTVRWLELFTARRPVEEARQRRGGLA